MAYTPTEWKNTVYDDKGNELQKGTPYSAENMNKIENQLAEVSNTKGEPGGTATLDESGIVPVSQLPSNLKEIRVVADLSERDELDRFEGLRVLVTDASADSTVDVGWAEYVWNGSEFIKVAEAESLDVVLSWDNVTGKPSSFLPMKHGHTEADIADLDKYTQAETNAKLEGKSEKNHTHIELHSHANKSALDNVTQGHLNKIGTNEERIETLEASSGQLHTHANKTTLDKIVYFGAKPTIDLNKLDELENHTHSYASLTGKPTIPTQTSQLTNNSGYMTSNASKLTVSTTAPASPKVNDIWIVI